MSAVKRSGFRWITGLIAALFLFAAAGSAPCVRAETVEQSTEETLSARQAFVYDTASGEYLMEKCCGKMYPASTTKLFSAYVGLLYLREEEQVTAGKELDFVAPDASRAYIYENQTLTVAQLVEAMLLPSGNDAAYIFACAAGRKIARDPALPYDRAVQVFVDEMNACARDLGLRGSHFLNPDGFHVGSHYTCVQDMAVIAELALKNPTIAKFAQLQRADVCYITGESNTWYNTNRLLHPDSEYYHEQAVGLKTGYTKQAGNCLVSAFRQGEGFVLIGVFGCPDPATRYDDVMSLAAQYVT